MINIGTICGLLGVALGYLVVISLARRWLERRRVLDMYGANLGMWRMRWESNRAYRARMADALTMVPMARGSRAWFERTGQRPAWMPSEGER